MVLIIWLGFVWISLCTLAERPSVLTAVNHINNSVGVNPQEGVLHKYSNDDVLRNSASVITAPFLLLLDFYGSSPDLPSEIFLRHSLECTACVRCAHRFSMQFRAWGEGEGCSRSSGTHAGIWGVCGSLCCCFFHFFTDFHNSFQNLQISPGIHCFLCLCNAPLATGCNTTAKHNRSTSRFNSWHGA